MSIRRLLAQATVTDLDAAERWYTTLLDGPPQARPMPGLLEWHLDPTFGVQVWREPGRAGHSTLVLEVSDLDTRAARLTTAGVGHDGPQPASAFRILALADPDGNRVVLTGE